MDSMKRRKHREELVRESREEGDKRRGVGQKRIEKREGNIFYKERTRHGKRAARVIEENDCERREREAYCTRRLELFPSGGGGIDGLVVSETVDRQVVGSCLPST